MIGGEKSMNKRFQRLLLGSLFIVPSLCRALVLPGRHPSTFGGGFGIGAGLGLTISGAVIGAFVDGGLATGFVMGSAGAIVGAVTALMERLRSPLHR
jgi:hypothetical protein